MTTDNGAEVELGHSLAGWVPAFVGIIHRWTLASSKTNRRGEAIVLLALGRLSTVRSETSNLAEIGAPRRIAQVAHDFLRRRWSCRSETRFAFGVSLAWLVFYNGRFWTDAAHAMWHGTFSSVVFAVSLFALVWTLQALLLLLLPSRRLMLAAASLCFVIAAATSFFVRRTMAS